jgi:hypothetical protein
MCNFLRIDRDKERGYSPDREKNLKKACLPIGREE